MKRQIEGVSEQIISSAQSEFLDKGFVDASLREIASRCGVSTSSIYTRFKDKAGLFDAVVSHVVQELNSWYTSNQEEFQENCPLSTEDSNKKVKEMFLFSGEKINFFIDYIYDNLKIFQILTMKSEGTRYSNFINDYVEMDVEFTVQFLHSIGSDILESGLLTQELLHILSSSLYVGIFETVIHGMSREDAHTHIKKLRRFFVCGWKDLFECNGI